MGLLPSLILGALLIAAFAVTAQQRLAIASHNGPLPARQIAYLMRTYHQGSLTLASGATPPPTGIIANPPPEWDSTNTFFTSCWDGFSVVTSLNGMQITSNNAVAQELARQSLIPPQYAYSKPAPWPVGYDGGMASQVSPVPGVGLSDGAAIQSGAGAVLLAAHCPVPNGAAAMQTRIVP